MAELSDSDKRILLGANYKKEEARRDAERGITDQTRLVQSRKEMSANIIGIALGVGVVAFLIGIANYYSRGTNYSSTLVIGCVVVVMASVATVAWFMQQRKVNR
jgi:hypothetical protein